MHRPAIAQPIRQYRTTAQRLHRLLLALVAILIFLPSCDQKAAEVPATITETEQALPAGPIKVASGSMVYVPAYARIYSYKEGQTMALVTTLAIHNTDPESSLVLRSVRYFAEDGSMLHEYLKQPRLLKPMATAIYHLYPEKPNTGTGSNAVVEWVSEKKISKPIIEAVMISTEGTQGISFISPGYPIRDLKE